MIMSRKRRIPNKSTSICPTVSGVSQNSIDFVEIGVVITFKPPELVLEVLMEVPFVSSSCAIFFILNFLLSLYILLFYCYITDYFSSIRSKDILVYDVLVYIYYILFYKTKN